MKKKLKLLLGFLISLGFLYYTFRNVEIKKIVEILKHVNYYYIILITIISFLSHGIRAIRWKYLVNPLKKVKVWTLFKIMIIAFMSNNVLPFRMAEFVRAYLLGQKENISKMASFATIVLERFFDLLGILIISGVFFVFAPVPVFLQNAGFFLVVAGICFISLIIFIKYKHAFVHEILNKLLSKFGKKHIHKIAELLNNFVIGLEAFSGINQILGMIILSILVWLLNMITFYYMSLAFNITIPFWKNFFPFLTTIIGVMIPSAPGFIGTFHEFCRQGLILAGVKNNDIAVSYAIVMHGLSFISITIVGLFFLWQESVSLFKITNEKN